MSLWQAVWLLWGLSGSLHFVQPGGNRALRSDVADALGVPAPLLVLHRAADVGEDFVQDGVPVQAVFAVVAPPETTAPARSFVFCFLDLRPALRGFSQLRASGRWLAREAIVARVSGFCPPGYQPRTICCWPPTLPFLLLASLWRKAWSLLSTSCPATLRLLTGFMFSRPRNMRTGASRRDRLERAKGTRHPLMLLGELAPLWISRGRLPLAVDPVQLMPFHRFMRRQSSS